jgi:hypothetical protein
MNTKPKPGVSYQPANPQDQMERSRLRAAQLGRNNNDNAFASLTRLLLRDYTSFTQSTFLSMCAYLEIPQEDKLEYFNYWVELLKAEKKIQEIHNPINDLPVFEIL